MHPKSNFISDINNDIQNIYFIKIFSILVRFPSSIFYVSNFPDVLTLGPGARAWLAGAVLDPLSKLCDIKDSAIRRSLPSSSRGEEL